MRLTDPMLAERLLPSLIDRLAYGPDESGTGGGLSEEALKRTVLRDLSWLLNTTCLESVQTMEEHEEARRSVVNYGVASLAGRTASEVDASEVAAAIEKAIRTFEPRLRGVHVLAAKRTCDTRETVVITIEAQLLVRPLREVQIRGVLDLDSSEISLEQVSGES